MSMHKHRQVHHLSREADPTGWVESITGLTEDQPATDLLNNGATGSQQQDATASKVWPVIMFFMQLVSKVSGSSADVNHS